ncbi:hypothetical protein BJ912DRAFT_479739 [Pholiota molesta]|nr:hypothetical protein BJ912DRAFT_479739 [Pholiota molesta]
MNIVRDLLSSIWSAFWRTAAVASSNATALPNSSRHPHYATYYDLLSTARHGTPLWLPEPNETQHMSYRRRGTAIGDVVVLTDNGGLHLLFNICLDADDPINGNAVPEGFSPFKPALLASDMHRFHEYGEDSYLASKSITKKRNLQGPAGLWFESSASEGAILAMPEGACSEDLARKSGFDRYLADNLDSWYHYVNEVREWGIEPGQLRLVTGVHKAKAWGIATFSNEKTAVISDLKMVFKSNEDISSGALYSWEFEGTVDSSRSGPTRKQREDVFEGRPPLENQCLFVRTVNALSRKVGGKNRESNSIAVPTSQMNTNISSVGLEHSGSAGPSNYSSSSSRGGGRSVPNQMGAQYSLLIGQNENGPVLRDHPSKAINEFLLEEKPNARIAITHDEDWISLLTEVCIGFRRIRTHFREYFYNILIGRCVAPFRG